MEKNTLKICRFYCRSCSNQPGAVDKTQSFLLFAEQKWDFNFLFPWQHVVKSNVSYAKGNNLGKQVGTVEMKVFVDNKLG